MLTLPIPPGTQLFLVTAKFQHEYGTVTNIKSHATTLAVQAAIKTALYILKGYRQTPENGLIIYAGYAQIDGKEKKISLPVNPLKPVTKKDYRCEDFFDVSLLETMLEDSEVHDFIIMDGDCCLFGKVQGSKKVCVVY